MTRWYGREGSRACRVSWRPVTDHPASLNIRAVSKSADDIQQFLARARSAAAARVVPAAVPATGAFTRAQLSGRLVEVSGIGAVASLTAAVGLVLEAQVDGDPVAWICLPTSSFYPPDLADSGVDLASLVVVRAPSIAHAGPAADRLLRSGGFGLVVLDLGAGAEMPLPLQGRLVGLAQRHDAAIVCLTEKANDSASLGSMVSLRAEALRAREDGAMTVRALKDKQRGPGWTQKVKVKGPAGL
jgi:recombination protein RecA